MIRLNRARITTVALFSLMAGPAHAQRLFEAEGIELRGAARVVEYGAGTCNVSEERETPTEYERKKANHGQAVDVWQLDLSVYNGSGRPLDHLIARYSIEAEHPPCTNWTWPEAGRYPDQIEWGNWYGTIQRSGGADPTAPGETLTRTVYLFVFHEHQPRFDSWSVDYNFAAGAPAAAGGEPRPVPRVAPPAGPVRQPVNPPSRPAPPPAQPTSPRHAPGDVFSDCSGCPQMVVVPAGTFRMGSPASEEGRYDDEGPQHSVTIPAPFAVGVYEVTFAEWDACVRTGGCGGYAPADEGWGRGNRPVMNVSWDNAQTYVSWLSQQTGQRYRLLSEAEWEYVARAGSRTARYWGASESGQCRYANGDDDYVSCTDGHAYTAPVGSFAPNVFGLYDVLGNVWEWTQDCSNGSYAGAPTDGSAWQSGECGGRVLRGGSWIITPRFLRSAYRNGLTTGLRNYLNGFRVARTLN
ncbi:formylglycine-generating enzyme family protein [Candidatus Palauibacter sp.]|uniref:formylglycine-generating enzyme family protein n=1 Tax=Candidatus Palauibacter sp. TaxID=3101350 RepID=UPI003B51BCB4